MLTRTLLVTIGILLVALAQPRSVSGDNTGARDEELCIHTKGSFFDSLPHSSLADLSWMCREDPSSRQCRAWQDSQKRREELEEALRMAEQDQKKEQERKQAECLEFLKKYRQGEYKPSFLAGWVKRSAPEEVFRWAYWEYRCKQLNDGKYCQLYLLQFAGEGDDKDDRIDDLESEVDRLKSRIQELELRK